MDDTTMQMVTLNKILAWQKVCSNPTEINEFESKLIYTTDECGLVCVNTENKTTLTKHRTAY